MCVLSSSSPFSLSLSWIGWKNLWILLCIKWFEAASKYHAENAGHFKHFKAFCVLISDGVSLLGMMMIGGGQRERLDF